MTNSMDSLYAQNKYIIWIIAGVLALLLIFRLFYGHPDPVVVCDDQRVKQSMDSLRIWTQQWQDTRYRDSIQSAIQLTKLTGIEQQVNRVPAMIQRINNRTNDQIHIIAHLPDNEQLSLFANWISTTDSL